MHGHQRQGEIGERVVLDERGAQRGGQMGVVPIGGNAGADDGAGAASGHVVHRDAGFAQCAQHADVREAARATAGKHQPGCMPADQSRHARQVAFMPDVMVHADARIRLQPWSCTAGRRVVAGTAQQQVQGRVFGQVRRWRQCSGRVERGIGQYQYRIALACAALAP